MTPWLSDPVAVLALASLIKLLHVFSSSVLPLSVHPDEANKDIHSDTADVRPTGGLQPVDCFSFGCIFGIIWSIMRDKRKHHEGKT